MTSQDKKHYLMQYTALNRAINQKLEELARLKALCEKTTTTLSDMPKGGGAHTREDTYARMIDLDREITTEIDRYIDMRSEIEAAISTVNNIDLQTLLRHKYIDGWTLEKIAVEMIYCYKQVCRLHGKALLLVKMS